MESFQVLRLGLRIAFLKRATYISHGTSKEHEIGPH